MTVLSPVSNYSNLGEIKANYHIRNGVREYIRFEGRTYKCTRKSNARGGGRTIIFYRNEVERHNVVIQLLYGVVMDVRAFYKI